MSNKTFVLTSDQMWERAGQKGPISREELGISSGHTNLHPPTIWVITVFTQASITDSGEFCGGSQRTWGFYFNHADALAALESNITDLFETCYHWAVLEEYEPGINGILPASTQWFKYDEERDGYFFNRTKTAQMTNYGAFAMGW